MTREAASLALRDTVKSRLQTALVLLARLAAVEHALNAAAATSVAPPPPPPAIVLPAGVHVGSSDAHDVGACAAGAPAAAADQGNVTADQGADLYNWGEPGVEQTAGPAAGGPAAGGPAGGGPAGDGPAGGGASSSSAAVAASAASAVASLAMSSGAEMKSAELDLVVFPPSLDRLAGGHTKPAASSDHPETLQARLVLGGHGSEDLMRQVEGTLRNLMVEVPAARSHALSDQVWAERARAILTEIGAQVSPAWQRFLAAVNAAPGAALHELSARFSHGTVDRYAETSFRETRLSEERAYLDRQGANTSAVASALRVSDYYTRLAPPPLRDAKWKGSHQPVFFEHTYAQRSVSVTEAPKPPAAASFGWANGFGCTPPPLPTSRPTPTAPGASGETLRGGAPPAAAPAAAARGVHLLIFVHGFHGNAYDLRTMRDHISLISPPHLPHISLISPS